MLHRRRFLSAVALAPAVVTIPAAVVRAEDDLTRAPAPTPASPPATTPAPALAPIGPLGRDLELAGGFRVVRAFDVSHGALPFVLEGEGERFQIDVLRRDPAGPGGVFDTERFSLFVQNHGSRVTIAAHERGARALGAALERRVADGAEVPALATFAQRRAQHPTAIYDVDYDAPPQDA